MKLFRVSTLSMSLCCLLCVTMLLLPLVRGQQTIKRVHVVAVQDSQLFTLCAIAPVSTLSMGEQRNKAFMNGASSLDTPEFGAFNAIPLQLPVAECLDGRRVLDRPRPDWPLLAQNDSSLCPSGRIDRDLKNKIERELQKQKGIALVDSADKADLVFLAEGISAYYLKQSLGNRDRHFQSFGIEPIFNSPRVRQAILAVAIPSANYLQHPSNSNQLLKEQIWEGFSTWKQIASTHELQPALSEILVRQFAQNLRATATSLCAPWSFAPDPKDSALLNDMKRTDSNESKDLVPTASIPDGMPGRSKAIKVDVTLVTVPLIASDKEGRYVSDLNSSEFHIFENGVAQQINSIIHENEPFNIALLLDTSASTTLRHEAIQDAALTFLEALHPADQIMIASFDRFIYLDSEFTADAVALRQAILKTQVGNETRLYDAIDLVLEERLRRISGRKAIVLLSDGIDSGSRLTRAQETLARIEESDVLVYVVQYDTKKEFSPDYS